MGDERNSDTGLKVTGATVKGYYGAFEGWAHASKAHADHIVGGILTKTAIVTSVAIGAVKTLNAYTREGFEKAAVTATASAAGIAGGLYGAGY